MGGSGRRQQAAVGGNGQQRAAMDGNVTTFWLTGIVAVRAKRPSIEDFSGKSTAPLRPILISFANRLDFGIPSAKQHNSLFFFDPKSCKSLAKVGSYGRIDFKIGIGMKFGCQNHAELFN